ncbi:MAG: hypothetical protein AVDCRST_MAG21-1167 [uncultured Nocardioidaceae bacterium]|uniref:Uncharacterized protein n=1 Tax=uncultured Nocardioidaceae bacterium TaxID=253824 RepID=A0A6J4N1W5_9ACTN|nr:MAG: hypothetical protein AVDCRST_MAG21-1167 [uncultured Nocardioidaceae bacterium]
MEVLWWLAPPLAATVLAMLWAGWLGRRPGEERRDDSDAALGKMADALARPAPSRPASTRRQAAPVEPSHGVAVRRSARRPTSKGTPSR